MSRKSPTADEIEQRRRTRKEFYHSGGKVKHKAAVRKYRESSFEAFLKCSLRSAKRQDKASGLEHNIDLQYLLEMLHAQGSECAVTQIGMTHKFGDLSAVSIDRINSTIGHVQGNIQLVCQGYNLAKRNRTDSEGRRWIQEIEMNVLRRLRINGYKIVKGNKT